MPPARPRRSPRQRRRRPDGRRRGPALRRHARSGVQICDQAGRVIAILPPPRTRALSNVEFGGPAMNELYVTSGDRVYRRATRTRGVRSADPADQAAPAQAVARGAVSAYAASCAGRARVWAVDVRDRPQRARGVDQSAQRTAPPAPALRRSATAASARGARCWRPAPARPARASGRAPPGPAARPAARRARPATGRPSRWLIPSPSGTATTRPFLLVCLFGRRERLGQRRAGARQPLPDGVRRQRQHGGGLRGLQPFAADEQQDLAVGLGQRRQRALEIAARIDAAIGGRRRALPGRRRARARPPPPPSAATRCACCGPR